MPEKAYPPAPAIHLCINTSSALAKWPYLLLLGCISNLASSPSFLSILGVLAKSHLRTTHGTRGPLVQAIKQTC
jgi:hypothetical protein